MRALIVGAGAMGTWFARLWKENLGEVLITDIDRKKARRVASKLGLEVAPAGDYQSNAEAIVVAVPISVTQKVVAEMAPKLGKGTLLFDLCSVKEEVVRVMKEVNSEAEMASIHPLFGPGAHTLHGKDVLSIPVKTRSIYKKMVERLRSLGARVTEMKAEEHDKLMSVIQCMTHFTLLAHLSAYESLKEFDKHSVKTPLFDSLMNSAKAILAGDPSLYGEIQVYNRYSRIVRTRILEACRSLDTILTAGNVKNLEEIFKKFTKSIGAPEVKKSYRRLYERFEVGE